MKTIYLKLNDIYEYINCEKRVYIYGAGEYALSILEGLQALFFCNCCAVVDKQYIGYESVIKENGGKVLAIEDVLQGYNSEDDVIIWGIASPNKLREFLNNETRIESLILIWNVWHFWKDDYYPNKHVDEFSFARSMLFDDYSKGVYDAFIKAYQNDIRPDISYATDGTYFNELTNVKREGAFVDCGAYDGENSLSYIKREGHECRIFAFEPDKKNYERIRKKIEGINQFTCINKGVYSTEKQLAFRANGDMSSGLTEEGNNIVEVTSIDSVVGEEKVAFIKMDVEGAEYEALKGAQKTIVRDMPILAISAYHRQEDFITLIPFIHSMYNEREKYNIFMRHHGICATELVIYAIPVSRIE